MGIMPVTKASARVELASRAPSGIVGSIRRTLLGMSKGTAGMIGRSATNVSSSGLILTVSFQPSSVAWGYSDKAIPTDAVEELHVVEVEVDRVRVHPVVRDLPDLRPVRGGADRSRPSAHSRKG